MERIKDFGFQALKLLCLFLCITMFYYITNVFNFALCVYKLADIPAGPPPIIITSYILYFHHPYIFILSH